MLIGKIFRRRAKATSTKRNAKRRTLRAECLESRLAMSAVGFAFDSTQLSNITVNGQSILGKPVGTGGIYLIGSLDGSDNSGHSVSSVGAVGGVMRGDPGVPSPPYKLTFTQTGDGVIHFTAEVGPVPANFTTLSLPFDFAKNLTDAFKFNGTSYTVSASTAAQNGKHQGSGATYDSFPATAVIPNTNGGKVSVATVNGPVSWGEVSGPLATVRVNITSSSHYSSMKFYNHFGTDNLELSFGAMRKGEKAFISGDLIVTPKQTAPGPLVIQAESTSMVHPIGRADADGWSVRVGDPANKYMSYGPYTTAVPAGQRTASFRLMLDNVTANNNRILKIDVYDADTGRVLASRDLLRKDFARAMQYQDFNLNFTAAGHRLEFRTYWYGGSYARQDNVTVK